MTKQKQNTKKEKFALEYGYSEEEVINLTISWGFDGSEFDKKIWKDRGCLKINGTYDKLIKKIKTRYQIVMVIGIGLERKYVLIGLKEEFTKILDMRIGNGHQPTESELIMDEGIMNRLIIINEHEEKWNSYTINTWANELFLFRLSEPDWSQLRKTLNKHYLPLFKEENVSNMMRFLKENVQTRRRDIVTGSFGRLAKSGRIKLTTEYMKVEYIDPEEYTGEEYVELYKNRYVDISKEEYQEMESYEKEKVLSLEVEWSAYKLARAKSLYASKKAKSIVSEVGDYMRDEFLIDRYFSKVKVDVLDDTLDEKVENREMNNAFIERFIELTNKRLENNPDYTSGERNYSMQLYKTNLFFLLNQTGYKEFIEKEQKDLLQAIPMEISIVKQAYRVASELKLEQERNDMAF